MSAQEAGSGPVAADVDLKIVNREAGQVIEVVVPGPVDVRQWPAVKQRLLTLVAVRQPAQLWLDLDGVGELSRFAVELEDVAAALAEVGGTLVAGSRADAAS